MIENHKTAVVIPCYKVSDHIRQVIESLPDWIDNIIVIDDACPDHSGRIAEAARPNVTVIYHAENQGVGGAVVSGYKKALELNADIIIKMDGDGQMDASGIDRLTAPIINNQADYAKGNRFRDFSELKRMPAVRLIGNSGLSFLVKAASGYWNIIDPTNGFTAIRAGAVKKLNLDKLSKRFFFESDLLINLNIINAVVADVSIPARYGREGSSLSVTKALISFPPMLMRGLIKRIALKYFVYDFNMASVYLILGLPMFCFGVAYGAVKWIHSISTGIPTPAGTIMLAALPIIVSFQMLLQAINIDINNVPKKN